MRNRIMILVCIVSLFVFSLSVPSVAQTVRKTVSYEVNRAIIELYNGDECSDALIRVEIVGRGEYESTAHSIEYVVSIGGDREKYELGWFPGGNDLEVYESNICIDNTRNGRGTLRVYFGFDEMFYTEFSLEDGFIMFRRRH